MVRAAFSNMRVFRPSGWPKTVYPLFCNTCCALIKNGRFQFCALRRLHANLLVGSTQAQTSEEIEAHIQRVTSGLIGGVVLKGHENETHTLNERMKELNVPGVSIAVIHNGHIEWARGFGVRDSAGAAVNTETIFQAGSISKRWPQWRRFDWCRRVS